MFDSMDKNNDGVLSEAELVVLAYSQLTPDGEALSQAEIQAEQRRLIEEVDSNGDGWVSFAEFEKYFRSMCEAQHEAKRKAKEEANAIVATEAEAQATVGECATEL